MKKLFYFVGAVLFIAIWVCSLQSADNKEKVFSKRRDLPLLESAQPAAKTVAKAAWNESLTVLSREGRWLKVSSEDGEGWVYVGNVSPEELPSENKNDMPLKASGMTAAAAGRGLSDGADAYADRHSYEEVAEQLRWAEKISSSITEEKARAYLKTNKLGEFADRK